MLRHIFQEGGGLTRIFLVNASLLDSLLFFLSATRFSSDLIKSKKCKIQYIALYDPTIVPVTNLLSKPHSFSTSYVTEFHGYIY